MSRRSYVVALAALGAGSALLLWAYGQRWATAVVAEAGLPQLSVDVSGREWFPAAAAAGWVALAGLAGVVATRRVGRVLVGLVLVAAGLLGAWPALAVRRGDDAGATSAVAARMGMPVDAVVTTTPWWWAALAGGLLVAAAGVAAVAMGGRWPVLGRRYERPAAGSGPAAAPDAGDTAGPAAGPDAAARTTSPPPTAADAWAALDRGEDPTA